MSSTPNFSRIFHGRRIISLSDSQYEKYPVNPSQAAGVRHPRNHPNDNQYSRTNATQYTPASSIRHTSNTGGGASSQQVESLHVSPSASFGLHTDNHATPARRDNISPGNLDFTNFEDPQGIWGNTPVGGQGAMTGGHDIGEYPQINIPSANIVAGSYDQQQLGVPGTSPLLSARAQLSTSLLETLNQEPLGLGQRSNNTQNQDPFDSSRLQPFLVIEWRSPIIVRINRDLPNSCIYNDTLEEALGSDRKRLIHPWPPGHYTVTRPGYAPKGGYCIQLTLRHKTTLQNREGRDVQLPLTILDRQPLDEKDVDAVLGQDYLWRFNALHNTPIRILQPAVDMGLLSQSHQGWQAPSQSQSAPILDRNLSNNSSNYVSPMWPSSNSQTQGVNMQPQYLAPPSFTNTVPSSQGSSGLVYSSATSPDGLSSSMGNKNRPLNLDPQLNRS